MLKTLQGISVARLATAALLLASFGCGGSKATARAADDDATSSPQPAREQAPAEPADESAGTEEAEEKATEEGAGDEQGGRDVRYHVTPEGLRVTVAGVSFEPKATAVRVGGGWGVRIDVDAKATDEQAHVLYSPENGPLAFAARVKRGAKLEQIPDTRKGAGEQFVTPGAPLKFSREWPGKAGAAPLGPGQELTLEVGLWGVGETSTRHRPVMKFFSVKMAVGQKQPTPSISPPDTP